MGKEKKLDYTVTPQGSLGLLALGDVGIKLWREAIEKGAKKKKVNPKGQHEQK
jgi:hypothetical protein